MYEKIKKYHILRNSVPFLQLLFFQHEPFCSKDNKNMNKHHFHMVREAFLEEEEQQIPTPIERRNFF